MFVKIARKLETSSNVEEECESVDEGDALWSMIGFGQMSFKSLARLQVSNAMHSHSRRLRQSERVCVPESASTLNSRRAQHTQVTLMCRSDGRRQDLDRHLDLTF